MSTAQVNNVLQLGGAFNSSGSVLTIPFPDIANVITIIGGDPGPTAGNKLQFTKMGITVQAQYRVTNGKTLYVYGFWGGSATNNPYGISFGYDTATFANNSAIAGTDIYYGPNNAYTNGPYLELNTVARFYQMPMSFPSDAYPFFRSGSNNEPWIAMIGIEL